MEEARAVLERLNRIDDLQRAGASATELLAEVRQLLAEGEAWLAAEPAGTERATEALVRCRLAYEAERLPLGA
jgi:hypothetical protein